MYTLMIKTHKGTGLKYLCKTTLDDPIAYKGSGKYWKSHLRKHGRDILTEIIHRTENLEEFKEVCEKTSKDLNVVADPGWANLIHENGTDGGTTHRNPHWLIGLKHTDESKKKISDAGLGRPGNLSTKGMIHTPKSRHNMSTGRLGMKFTESHRANISKAKLGKKSSLSTETRQGMAERCRSQQSKLYRCSVCTKTGNNGTMGRYHKECMKDNTWTKIPL